MYGLQLAPAYSLPVCTPVSTKMEALNYSGLLQPVDNGNVEPEGAGQADRSPVESYHFKLNCQLAHGAKLAFQLVLTLAVGAFLLTQPKLCVGAFLVYFVVLLVCFYSGSWDWILKSWRTQIVWFGLITVLESTAFSICCMRLGPASYSIYFPMPAIAGIALGLAYKKRTSPYAQTTCLILYTTSLVCYTCYAWLYECEAPADFVKALVLAAVPLLLYRSLLGVARRLFQKKLLKPNDVLIGSLPCLCVCAVVRRA